MNIKLIAIVAAAFIAGHDIAVTRANRKHAKLENQSATDRAELMLTWFHLGHEVALSDKDRVAEAFNSMNPPPRAEDRVR